MRKEEKNQIIEWFSAEYAQTPNFYVVDIAGLNAEQTSSLRRDCFNQGIKLAVVKNTLVKKALEKIGGEEINAICSVLEGPTAIMFTTTPNTPAKLIKKYNGEGKEKPLLKGAYVQECAFVGADKLSELCSIKSKEELIGEIITILQSPARNVISALQNAGGQKIAGLVKALEEKK